MLRTIEKLCVAGILILALVILAGVGKLYNLYRIQKDNSEPVPFTEETKSSQKDAAKKDESLAAAGDFLPQNLSYGKKLPVTAFETADGSVVDLLEEYPGQSLVLMYWGSWCSYCDKQLRHVEEFEAVLHKRNARFILVNKTDPDKDEDVTKAAAYLQENRISQDCVFDTKLTAYQAYGVRRIPTTIVVDEEGYVRAIESQVIDSGEQLEALLAYAAGGGADSLMDFIDRNMKNADGGIYTNYVDGHADAPSGHDVLSESMGLLMEYAVMVKNQAIFDEAYRFAKEHMQKNGLFAWYVSKDGSAGSNAFLDDIRIAGALCKAHMLWGGYEEYEELVQTILLKNTYKNQFSSFYDFEQRLSGNDISLCYADFQVLERLGEDSGAFAECTKQLRQVVEGGYIGDEFPLYYASWDYKKKEYAAGSLNTAEALLTLYHLAQVQLLKDTSLEWLRERLIQDDLAARYETDGSVTPGFDYDSTAVYAIAALIGKEAGDSQIYMLAFHKMEQFRVTDTASPYYGGFTAKDNGEDITAFDQLMPLLVYADFENVRFE